MSVDAAAQLADLTTELARAYTLSEVAKVLTRFSAQVLAASVTEVALARDSDLLEVLDHHVVGAHSGAVSASRPIDPDEPIARAHRDGRTIVLDDHALEREHTWLAAAGHRAGIVLPLSWGDLSLGALGVWFPTVRSVDPTTRALADAIARQGAVALDRVELLERAKRETARIRYLAHAGALLASTRHTRDTLATLADLAVPELADWAAVDLFVDGGLQRLAVAHRDPAKVALVAELVRKYPPRLDDPRDGLGEILRTGQPQHVREIPEEMLVHAARDEEHLRALRELGLRSYVCVPITSRDRVRGAFTLIAAESGRRYDEDDLELALEIARRASIALDTTEVMDDLRAAERRREEFLAMLGHELRNPLAVVAAASELMDLRPDDPSVLRSARESVARQVAHMRRMLDDLLDVARISRGRMGLQREEIDMAEIVRQTAEDHRAELERAGIALRLDISREPLPLDGDRTRIAQIIANLLHNARKFTPAGGHVDVGLHGAGAHVVLTVRDDGIGIAQGVLDELFEPFTQAQRTHDRTEGGLGLGLAVARGLVELHGGTIEARSEGPGHGAVFTVKLPRLAGDSVGADTKPRASTGSLRVLIVEDDPDGGQMMRLLIEALGHEVVLAVDGASAIEHARTLRPALVLCDIGLPGAMNGHDVAKALRAAQDVGDPLLVAVTGFGVGDHQRRAEVAGFDRFIVKPIALPTLRELLDLARTRRG